MRTVRDRRIQFWIVLLVAGLFMLGGCQSVYLASSPHPTRTPKPTFTPVIVVDTKPGAEPKPVPLQPTESAPPTPTPELQLLEAVVSSSPEPSPTPTLASYSSPAAPQVPKTGRAILIDQDQQQMYIFEDGVEIRAIPCSTGDPDNHGTQAWQGVVGKYVGTFKSFDVYSDYAWYLFKDQGSILIHGAPYVWGESGERVYQEMEALGRYPSSHGCIRIHPDEARWLTFWNPAGVPVIITAWTGGESLADATDH